MTDESAHIDPFLFGNPAGLALLSSQNRLDYSYEWFKQTSAYFNTQSHLYGTLGELNNDTVGYHGLILFPIDRWGVQLDGDFLNKEGDVPPSSSFLVVQNKNRTRETIRTAYNFGPFVLGAQVQPVQNTPALNNQAIIGNTIVSQSGTTSSLLGTAGLLISLLGDTSLKKDRLEIGGSYTNQLKQAQEIDNFQITVFPNTLVNLTNTLTDTNIQSWGPELYLDSPGSFQAALIGRFVTIGINTQLVSSDTTFTLPSASLEEASESLGIAIFKMKTPLPASLTLNNGLLFSFSSSTYNIDPTYISTVSNGSQQQWQLAVGTGVEKTGDFTVGFQGEMDGTTGNQQTSGNTIDTINYFSYKTEIGGEKWISAKWAFRIGIIYQNELNMGTQPYQTFFYKLESNQRVVNTTITTGLGFQDEHLKSDLMFWYGLPSVYDNPNPNAFGTQLGFQLAMGILF